MKTETAKAEQIRSVIRYIKKFKDATVVIYIDDELIDSPLFSSHIRDIALIHASGLNVVIIPGARNYIDKTLTKANIPWKIKNGCRITSEDAMPLIKTAAFEISNIVMTGLAGEHINAVIGNWVRARGMGVIDGFDFATSGEIDKLEIDSIRTILEKRFIPIFPCIGWSLTGKPYNISSLQLAQEIAVYLQADKLFFVVPEAEISKENFIIPDNMILSKEGHLPALNIEELNTFMDINQKSPADDCAPSCTGDCTDSRADDRSNNQIGNPAADSEQNRSCQGVEPSARTREKRIKEKILSLLRLSKKACALGVHRVHILNGLSDGVIPCEIFSELGSGTMIYTNNYGRIREMRPEDIPAVLRLMRPFVEKGILLPRTESSLFNEINDFIIYELDDGIRACAALHIFEGAQGEIAALAVDESYSHTGIGPKLISHLTQRAKKQKLKNIFVLTTQTADWFENLGFKAADIQTLPEKRKKTWTANRNSKLLRMQISD
ncbi:GNAT family N-acetyltransferase [Treponema parvum]|uniref:GNAT family N-acetyltransferase n=1 Tax=Treponema parvum TaxID=138851 RepID=UPI001AEBE0CC|nr:GNAT family N-acetyltransferase [Treponema parvum]QTQ17308.1 GNAT family N-acetyltransferase [Treponema parvum]